MATLIAVYAHISFASIRGIGWGWAGVIWIYSLIFYIPLDVIKFAVRYALSGEAWDLIFDRKVSVALFFNHIPSLLFNNLCCSKQTAFTLKKDYGKEEREAKWVRSQQNLATQTSFHFEINGRRSSMIAEQAKRRAEIAR